MKEENLVIKNKFNLALENQKKNNHNLAEKLLKRKYLTQRTLFLKLIKEKNRKLVQGFLTDLDQP